MSSHSRITWAIITGEYPPQPGGVSDYSMNVAEQLAAAGDEVYVLAPPLQPAAQRSCQTQSAVVVHRLEDHFGKSARAEAKAVLETLATEKKQPPRLLVQYVPHAFGHRAMNVPLCWWLFQLRRVFPIDVMFHEVAYPLQRGQPMRHNLLALANRLMARLLVQSARRIFVSTPAWKPTLRRIARSASPCQWLPIPSNLPTHVDVSRVALVRQRFLDARSDSKIIGHFGTYGRLTTPMLQPLIDALQREPNWQLLLLGRGGDAFAATCLATSPEASSRVRAAGALGPQELAEHIAACDVMIQPYPDGISTRRSSAMAALALGVPIVTCAGEATEPVWRESGAVVLTDCGQADDMIGEVERLLEDPAARQNLARRAGALYRERFAIQHTIARLRELR